MNYNILFIVPDIVLIILFIKESKSMLECKKLFTCSYCNTFLGKIRHGDKCNKCHRTIKVNGNSWEHYMTFRYTYIDSKNKNYTYDYKSYKKWFIFELVICGIGIIALTLVSILSILSIVG